MKGLIKKIKKRRALFARMLLTMLTFMAMVLICYFFMSDNAHRNLVRNTENLLDYEQYLIDTMMQESQITLDGFSRSARYLVSRGVDSNGMKKYIDDVASYLAAEKTFASKVKSMYGYFETLTDGPAYIGDTRARSGEGADPTQSRWFKEAVAADGEITEILSNEYNESIETLITYAICLYGEEGQRLGVVAIDVKFDDIKHTIIETAAAQGGAGLLIGKEMKILAHSNPDFIGLDMSDPRFPSSVFENDLRNGVEVTERPVKNYLGEPNIAFFRALPNGWYLGILIPESLYYESITRMAVILIALGAAFALALIFVLVRLDLARERSDIANLQKSVFLANISHEIRTPMNTILGIAEIQLQDKKLSEKTKEAFTMMHGSGELLLGIINDLLDMSKMEAGKFELTFAKYELASLINDVMMLNMARMGSKPIEFELFIDENTPSALFGDELRIKQILNNLLSNSWKYTKKGMITLSVSIEAGDGGNSVLVLKVKDTGIGMTEEQVGKLFDEYTRFNMEANRTTQGTGLGMSIVRNLLNMMGGEIHVTSTVDVGSEFVVRIPQRIENNEPLGKELVENLQMFRKHSLTQIRKAQILIEPMPYGKVLVVDDVESNLYVAKGLLDPYQIQVETASSGFEAIDRIKEGRIYDIVFMDHMMPEMDGIEAVRIIRESGYALPIVALTANAVVGQADMFLSSGFNDFVSKPIDIRELNTVLKKHVRDKQPMEILEAAHAHGAQRMAEAPQAPGITAELAEIFTRDAAKAITLLEEVCEKRDSCTEKEQELYIITVHGLKSALSNVGAPDLSAVAAMLEQAGRDANTELMAKETPAFLDKLRALVGTFTTLASAKEAEGDAETGEMESEDLLYLKETLAEIQKACSAYDKRAAEDAVRELRKKPWAGKHEKTLATISGYLLHSDFDEAYGVIETLAKEL